MTRRWTSGAIAIGMLWSSLAAQAPAPPAEIDLPKVVRRAIDGKLNDVDGFKKWKVATFDGQAFPCREPSSEAMAHAQGDFSGDGRTDHAVLVQGDGRMQLVVVVDRLTDPTVVDVDDAWPDADAGYLLVEPKGGTFINPSSGIRDYLSSDTLVVMRCGKPPVAYFWTGLGFRKVELSQSE